MIPKNIYRAWQTQTFHKKVEKRIKKTIRINKEYSHVTKLTELNIKSLLSDFI